MKTATWQDTVVARSDDTVVVENNLYFPTDALVRSIGNSNALFEQSGE